MKIVPIFPEQNPCIYAVCFDDRDDVPDEFNRLFDLWSDTGYLEEFFEKNEKDLGCYGFTGFTVEEAIQITINEAEKLEDLFYKYAESGLYNPNNTLEKLFRPLDNNEPVQPFQKSKAYGNRRNSWLRVYAIRIAPNLFVITGGAIKLTQTMSERPHTKTELLKLEQAKAFLRKNGLLDESDFELLEI